MWPLLFRFVSRPTFTGSISGVGSGQDINGLTAMATSPAASSASKRPFYSDAGRRFVDALDLFIAEMFTGAPKKGLSRPKATSVKALVKTLFHAPYGFWVDDLASAALPRKWRIRWKTASSPPSYRISGPQCNDIDELATVLGFESLAAAGNPSEGKLVSLIALVPALVLLYQLRTLLKPLSLNMHSKCSIPFYVQHQPILLLLLLLRNFFLTSSVSRIIWVRL